MIKIKVDIDRLTLDDVIFLLDNEGRIPPRFGKQLLAKVVVDEHGAFLEPEAALAAVGQMELPVYREALAAFRAQLAGLQEHSVPPTTGGS